MDIAERVSRWHRPLLIELFAIANLTFLSLDVFLAHSINAFRDPAEWVPVASGVAGATVLGASLVLGGFDLRRAPARWAGYVVGFAAILLGIVGLFLHLRSSFFEQQTLKSLVYAAPFAAPLSFAGLGFLVLLNRSVAADSLAWGQWVLFFAWGGFVGNFALSLTDHAQNGFFDVREWIPVVAAALAVGFLFFVMLRPADARLLAATWAVLGLQGLVGLLGFVFHVLADLRAGGPHLFHDVLHGAPPFAPLLFADLAALAAIAVWDTREKTQVPVAGGCRAAHRLRD